MTQEKMLRQAAAPADQAIRDSLPAPEECRHEFSPAFETKIRRLSRRARHPVLYLLPKYAACLVLAVLVAGGGWLTVDAEARANFVTWVRERCDAFVEYRFAVEKPTGQLQHYCLTDLPEGYTESERMELDNQVAVVYQDEAGHMIHFFYTHGSDAISLFIVGDTSQAKQVPMGDTVAELYPAEHLDEASVLVWISEQDGMAFCISAALPEQEMIQLCESIKKNNLPELYKQAAHLRFCGKRRRAACSLCATQDRDALHPGQKNAGGKPDMKWLTRVVTVCIMLGGAATIGIFGVLIFFPPDSAPVNAALLQGGEIAAMVLRLGLMLGIVRAMLLLFKE